MRYVYFTKTLPALDVGGLLAFVKEVGLDGVDLAVRPGHPVHPDNGDLRKGGARRRVSMQVASRGGLGFILAAPGKFATPAPVFFTAGVPHRFTCAVKADRPAEVTVQLNGEFDGKPQGREGSFRVGTGWSAVSLEFTPPRALAAGLRPTLTVPPGATLLVDSVRFRPLTPRGR